MKNCWTLQEHPNRWFGRTVRRLLQERAANGDLDENVVKRARRMLAIEGDEAAALAALWTLHVTGNLEKDDCNHALSNSSDNVRAWCIQLATERSQQPRISSESLVKLAATDKSASVRLALASALPMLPLETRWNVAESLASHQEDANDRFLPKMIWYGFAESTTANVPRAMQLARSTPLEVVSDSIYWYLCAIRKGALFLSN